MKKKWICVCGYVHDGDNPPAVCPKCGAPADKFNLLDEDAATLVERSRLTNALHCRLVSLAGEIEQVSVSGIEDNLDPNCVGVFEKARQSAWEIMKLSLTEMQGHVGKKKWG